MTGDKFLKGDDEQEMGTFSLVIMKFRHQHVGVGFELWNVLGNYLKGRLEAEKSYDNG